MPRGADAKREHEYEELKEEFHDQGRYKGREDEVAARIVNKQRAEHGETNEEHEKDTQGRSPDRNLPIHDYDQMTVEQATHRLSGLSRSDLQKIKHYEEQHQNRRTMIEQVDRHLSGAQQ